MGGFGEEIDFCALNRSGEIIRGNANKHYVQAIINIPHNELVWMIGFETANLLASIFTAMVANGVRSPSGISAHFALQ